MLSKLKIRSLVLALLCFAAIQSDAQAQATLNCHGWVGPKDASTATPLEIITDVDHSTQTAVSGRADGVFALLLYFKETNHVEISVTDIKTRATAGSHGGFNGQGLLNTGYSLVSADGKTERHVLFECQLNQ